MRVKLEALSVDQQSVSPRALGAAGRQAGGVGGRGSSDHLLRAEVGPHSRQAGKGRSKRVLQQRRWRSHMVVRRACACAAIRGKNLDLSPHEVAAAAACWAREEKYMTQSHRLRGEAA